VVIRPSAPTAGATGRERFPAQPSFYTLERRNTTMQTKTWRYRLLVPLFAAAAVTLPLRLSANGLASNDACAQTGTCWNDDNTCFVNGNAYPGHWERG